MAQKGVHLDPDTFSCSICLDLLEDPVTIPCGHSYCMGCIQTHWDGEDEKRNDSCPQCRQMFSPRPVLVKSTMLAALVAQSKSTGPPDHCYAAAEDVACDVCTGRKLKAVKSCLQCLVSCCDKHLQPHFESAAFAKHKLVDPSETLQKYVCSQHSEVMKMFCRTDHRCICYLCFVDEHKGHDTVSIAAERTERQRELEERRQKIQKSIQDREEDVKVLQQEVEAIYRSADEAVENSEKMLTGLIRLMEKMRHDVKHQIRSMQGTDINRAVELGEKPEREMTELRRMDSELEKLSRTDDHSQFLQRYPSVSKRAGGSSSSRINVTDLRHFEVVTAAVSKLRDTLQHHLSQGWTNISQTLTRMDGFLSNPEPEPATQILDEFMLHPDTFV